jgi:uncharacterized Zn finger protein (UPF0148 family)
MESEEFNIVQLELKYCERCGGLWVRRMGGEEIYCPSCAVEMVDFAASSRRKPSTRPPVSDESEASAPKVIFICGEGGNA